MIKITVGTTTKRNTIVVSEDAVVKDVLDSNNIDYTVATIMKDGAPFRDLNMTIGEAGITEGTFLVSVVKANNANEVEAPVKKESKPTLRVTDAERQIMYSCAVEGLMNMIVESEDYLKTNEVTGIPRKLMLAQIESYKTLMDKIAEFIVE